MKRRLLASLIIIIMISLLVIINVYHKGDSTIYDKNTDTYNINGIVYTKEKLIDKCFNLNLPNNHYIKEFKIEPDIEEAYAIDLKLIIPENQISKTFNFYDDAEKMIDGDGWFKSNLFTERGINKTNFNYYYALAEKAERKGVETQRSTFIIFTKPTNGEVTVFLCQDKLGWN